VNLQGQCVEQAVPTGQSIPAASRVLLSAYQCGPGMGSVSQIGWEWYAGVARRLPVTLVTHVRNRPSLEAAGAPVHGSHVIFIDTEWFAGPLYRLATRLFPKSEHAVFLLSSMDYFLFDWMAVRTLRRMMRQGARWDLCHVATPVSPVAVTRLHRLKMPVIRGPLNGNLGTHPAFRSIMQQDAAWLYPLRHVGRLLDAIVGSSRHSARLLVATGATLAGIPRRLRRRCRPMCENGVVLDRFTPGPWPGRPSASTPLRVLFVGRLVPCKALPLLLRAIALVQRDGPVHLTVIGDGPMRAAWKHEAAVLGLCETTAFLGHSSLDRVAAAMRACHVLCLPSVRESGGAVLLEAMACARPVIAVAFGGPAELVDDAVGAAVAPASPDAAVQGIATALRDVMRQPDRWRARGLEGRRRVEARYGWDAKVEEMMHLYEEVRSEAEAAAQAGSNRGTA
jgi:glycosyltransferase involved in cell wall biosynthesis